MATDKVMITISGLQDHEVILASESHPDKTLHQAGLFQATDSVLTGGTLPEAQPTSVPLKSPSEAAGTAGKGKKPWGIASGDPTAVNFRPDIELHAKMEWVCENVPKMSRLRILREGADLRCEQLIAKHYRHEE